MFKLEGHRALITGATGGIGQEIARTLHGLGASVGLSGTRAEKLEGLAAELGERAEILPCNLSDAEAVAVLPEAAEKALGGRVDILVHNAGITKDQLFMRMSDEDWDTVLRINLDSGFKLMRGCIRGMMKNKWGRIISITSVVGTTGNAGQGNYAASKAALVGLSKSLAQEVASRGITVNCIAPGFIETPMTDVLDDKQREGILASVPAKRLGTGQEIAAGVAFLASEEASYLTGQTLHINGGMAMI